jgi:hypothetical protein
MNYTVKWTDQADQQLANIWLNAPDKDAVTAASNRIESLLRRDPLGQGESCGGNSRLMFEPPLGAYYRVYPKARVVWVASIGRSS